jgi:2-C-methyl-D-erythritol 4-phosphate cytidylyltransferase/2-C-methyl-D-erythritol 2,4-cyclodiphosphate synthase
MRSTERAWPSESAWQVAIEGAETMIRRSPFNTSVDVVVVAAGESRRMRGIDNLDVLIAGRPLLAWTLEHVAASPIVEDIVVVTSPERMASVRTAPWLPDKVREVVPGGHTRHESVAEGIGALGELPAKFPNRSLETSIVLVHDGARPLVTSELIARVAEAVVKFGAAIPVVPVAETVKRVSKDDRVRETVDRGDLRLAQTPQGATHALFERALRTAAKQGNAEWTDEAAFLEACKIRVHAVPGDPANIKVTVPSDLERVEWLLGGVSRQRTGFGRDSHPFGPGSPLALGGILVEGAPRLAGHSDGDVAVHAVADALLGAAGLPDLGRQFPPDARTPTGIASTDLLRGVVDRLRDTGARPRSIDVTIVGARPRIADRLDAMRGVMAELVGLPFEAVSVKASTGNLAGMEGAGRGISAEAIAVVDMAR